MKKSFLASQRVHLAKRPLIVATLTNGASLISQVKKAKSSGADVIELRLDTFPAAYGAFQKAYDVGRNVVRTIKATSKLPILLTFRAANERGPVPSTTSLTDKNRFEIMARLLPVVELVDVEIRRTDFARKMTVVAGIHGTDVIHSIHDFKTPGRAAELTKWSRLSQKLGKAVFKVAVTPRTNDDVERFLDWGLSLKNPHKVLIAMGAVGRISRVVGYSFGSILTYGHLGESAALGQMSVRDLAQSIRGVYPS